MPKRSKYYGYLVNPAEIKGFICVYVEECSKRNFKVSTTNMIRIATPEYGNKKEVLKALEELQSENKIKQTGCYLEPFA